MTPSGTRLGSTYGPGATVSPGRYTSAGHGRGWCLAVDVPEIMQRLFQQFFDRRGCNPCCMAVDVLVSCSDVQQTSRATLGSTVNTCIASASWGCWKNFHIFYVMVDSGPEVDSVLLSCCFSFRRMEVRTVDASVASRVGPHENLVTTFTSPRTWQSLAPCLCIAFEKCFYPVSDTGEVAGSPGVLTPK